MDAPCPTSEPAPEELIEAFAEVLGYVRAYRAGAPAGPELGWAIRNFDQVCAELREEDDD